MEIRGVSKWIIKDAARDIGARCDRWRDTKLGVAFVLRPAKPGPHRYGVHTGRRRVFAICYHGHYDFMEAIFKKYPNAVIITTMARYNGVEEFKLKTRNLDPRKGFQATFYCHHEEA